MEKIEAAVKKAADIECKDCLKSKIPFADFHHAYIITLEEVEETEEDVQIMRKLINETWCAIKCDDDEEEIWKLIDKLEENAVQAAAEAIQVAAMCKKAAICLGR